MDKQASTSQQKEATSWEGKSKGTGLGFRIFIALLKTGGLKAAYALLIPVTLWYRLFRKEATAPLYYLYKERLGFSPTRSKALVKRNLEIFGQTLIDKIAVLSGTSSLQFKSIGENYLYDMVAMGKGGIVLSAHLGNWEVAGHMLEKLNTTINVVMYDGEAEALKKTLAKYNSKRSFNIIPIADDLNHIYEINAALQRNELICLHADRFRPGNRTFSQVFLGEDALFPAGPFILAAKLKAPVCMVFAVKNSDFEYGFTGFPPKTYPGAGLVGAKEMLADYVGYLEMMVRKHPEQWFNYFNFWRTTS